MKFLIAFACLLAIVTAKPGVTGHIAAPGFGYSSITAHAAPIVAHTAVAHQAAIATPSLAHHAVAAAPIASARIAAAPAAAIAHHAAVVTPPAVAHHVAAPAITHHIAAPAAVAYSAPIAAPAAVAYSAPIAAAVAPVIEKTQYHAQDVLGQASYGHTEAFQHHQAVQDAAGNKIGSYSWVAPTGEVIAAKYVADALGYRVHSNAVPVGPAAIAETPEVIAARSAHIAAHIAAKSHHHLVRRGVVAPAVAYTAAATPVQYTTHYNSAIISPVIHHSAHLHYGLF